MDKKPLLDSDIDPKRIHKVADGLRRQGEFESARMLDGYADLLEAREKAVPVATVEDQFGFPIMGWIGDAGEKCPVGTNLYTHSTQAQPPAASVTDAMVERAQDCLHDKGKDIGYYHMRAALETALAAQENPNG